jgi:3-oxoacyl-[acyl-carrier-protein] synthase-3
LPQGHSSEQGDILPGVIISALGCYVPPAVLTNHDLEKMVDTSDEWILQRVGISERHISPPELATSDLAVEAGKAALAQRGIDGSELDAILVCTVTPDMMFPSTACLVQHRLGAKHAWGFDLVAACSGFVYGLTTAAELTPCRASSITPTATPACCSATAPAPCCWSLPRKRTASSVS